MLVHPVLIGFADIDLQMIVVAQWNEALYQSFVILCENGHEHISHWILFTGVMQTDTVISISPRASLNT